MTTHDVAASIETAICRNCHLPVWRPRGDELWFSEAANPCCPDVGGQVASYHQPERGGQV